MARSLTIGKHKIHDESDCFVIAEIGHNHQGNVETARKMFQAAKDCGAQAVKLQKRDNRALYTREMYYKPYENRNSYGRVYGEHREALEFGDREWRELAQLAEELDLVFFATPFDIPSADFLADYDPPAFKTASALLTDIPLLKHIASFGKPMLVSTGAAMLGDVQRAYDAIMPINQQLCILQCTAEYPAEFADLNLRVIETYQRLFPDVVVGWSGHDNGIAMAVVAYVLGARVIEKHFTLNRAMKGTDQAFSLEPEGMRKMVRDLRRTRIALGDGIKRRFEEEEPALIKMGKSLVAARDLPAGHVLKPADIAIKSPGGGLAPYELEKLIGLSLVRPVQTDDQLSFDVVAAAVGSASAAAG